MVLNDGRFEQAKCPAVLTSSLKLVSRSHALRCDAKQAERRFAEFDTWMSSVPHFYLGDYLPTAMVKGGQPVYLETTDATGIPVISTLAIQQLSIQEELCRFISEEDFAAIEEDKKPRKGDVLLTMDGGTSIGKPVLFDLDKEFSIDSHVAILRPVGLDARWLVYLLASPLGQIQFNQAESGASGQTAVTEDDIRLFRFPRLDNKNVESVVAGLDSRRGEIAALATQLKAKEADAWDSLGRAVMEIVPV
jgi:hypothetical protein